MLHPSLVHPSHQQRPWGWLILIGFTASVLSWGLWSYTSPAVAIMGTIALVLAVLGVRACERAGFPTWAGLFSLSFGTAIILVGTFVSIGEFGWAVAIALTWAGVFGLDAALSHAIAEMEPTGLAQLQILRILGITALIGLALGWFVSTALWLFNLIL